MKRVLLIGVLILALLARLYKISNPIADWHSFRQADTASVTREYLKHGIDLLHPTYHDLSNIQSGKDNLLGYRMVEFPLLNGLTAAVIQATHQQANEVVVGRAVIIAFSLIALVSIYGLGTGLSGWRTGFFASVLFAVLPYAVYYSRAIMPDMPMVAMTVLALLLYLLGLKRKNLFLYAAAVVSFAIALLFKPYAVFFVPVFFALSIYERGLRGLKDLRPFILPVLAAIPVYFWRQWILQYPEGIPASTWLLNKENIRFTGAFFHWLFEVRISTLILGIGLVTPAVLGLIKKGKDQLVYVVWGVCMLAYLSVFAGGNVQHDYYQILLLPFLVMTAARGMDFLLTLTPKILSRWVVWGTIAFLCVFSLFVSWYELRGYYNVNHPEIMLAGQAADKILPPDAKVIAPYMGDTAFLFQTNRTGWPIGFYIDDKIAHGAQYYISVNFDDEANELMAKYATVEKNDKFVILDLQKPLAK